MLTLIEISEEVKKNWTPNYSSDIESDVDGEGHVVSTLIVFYENGHGELVEAARVTEALKVFGEDEDAVDQLNKYISR